MASESVTFNREGAGRIINAVREVENKPIDNRGRPRRTAALPADDTPSASMFVAEIVRSGPDEGDADYTTEQYWVRELALPAAGESWSDAAPLEGGRWVTAHNLDELGGQLHAIWHDVGGVVVPTSKRYALVHEFVQSGATRYAFTSYPAQRVMLSAYLPTDCDEDGCPTEGEWVGVNGPAFTQTTDCGGGP